jgi:hypothetical protein
MSRPALPFRRSACVAIGLIALGAACGDRETVTDVAAPTVGTPRVTAPSLAVGGNKPSASYEVNKASLNVATDNEGIIEVLCTPGKRALGGGFQIVGGVLASGPDVHIYESSPRVTSGTDGWRLDAMNRTGESRQFDVYVICAAI